MGLPITGQVRMPMYLFDMDANSLHHQHYNLIALAFYLGSLLSSALFARMLNHTESGFLIWVFPTMYISQKLRLGKYLGANIVLWGIIMMLHAVPKTFGPFFVLRFLLGQSMSHKGDFAWAND